MSDTTSLAIKIAAAVLKQKGEISVSEIKAIPFLPFEEAADAVVDYLLRHYKAELHQVRVESKPMLRWEQFIRLTSSVAW